MNRVQNTKMVLWIIVGFAAAVGLNRFIFGLGATTNLTDSTPWGLWIGFDVMGGVALAAGGFVLTAAVYMMKKEEFHPLVKPAVLTAFLGYVAVVIGLMFDLGLPWNIWHLIIFWNPSSPLFEVGWCVMLYSAVLLLEFSPTPLEKFSRYAKIRNFLIRYRFVLVLLGIMLSTLHQSSLGALYLIMPYKLHPLWYSNILPVNFFISAIALGLMMVSLESLSTHWLYKRKQNTNLISKLCKALAVILSIYIIVRIADIIINGKLSLIFNGSWESNLFIAEILISVIIPIILFSKSEWRNNVTIQWSGSILVVFGMVFNRINVGGLTMLSVTGDSYVPSWMEITISLGVVSAAVLVFLFALENFNIWKSKPEDPQSLSHTLPSFDYSSQVWLGTPGESAISKYSLAFIIAFALGMAFMPSKQLHGEGVEVIKVAKSSGWETMIINGNRDDHIVKFPHKAHVERIGEKNCATCHHIILPTQLQSSCWECHTNMYSRSDFFNHDWHASDKGAALSCNNCHTDNETKNINSAKSCQDCHKNYEYKNHTFATVDGYYTFSYTDAMHKLCVSCHFVRSKELAKNKDLNKCTTCHISELPEEITSNITWETSPPHFNSVILPIYDSTKFSRK